MSPRATAPRIGATELAVALGAVNLLFLAFVLVQLRFLFGGSGLVEQRVGLTYAEYARHGFFELVVVAVLVLPLLLGVDAVANGTRRQVRLVRGLSPSPRRARRRRHGVGAAAALAVPAAVRPDGAAYLRDRRRALARRRLRLARRDGAARPPSPVRHRRGRAGFAATLCLNVSIPTR